MYMKFALTVAALSPAQYKAWLATVPPKERRKVKAYWDKIRKDPNVLFSGGRQGLPARDSKGRFVKRNPRKRSRR